VALILGAGGAALKRKIAMIFGLILLLLLGGLLLWQPRGTDLGGGTSVTMADGRAYLAFLPKEAKGAPLIVALHGGGGSARGFARNIGLAGPAMAAGYAVIFPDGTGSWGRHTFNAGFCCGSAARGGVDDLGFLDRAIADAKTRFALDPGPVAITGLSNGAMMAETYAATRPAAVRALIAVSGTLDLARFPPKGKVPALFVHGTADQNVPFDGGLGARSYNKIGFTPVKAVVAAFLAPWGSGLQRQDQQGARDAQGYSVNETTYSSAGHPVLRLVAVQGGDHGWPGSNSARRLRRMPNDLSANALLLAFLAQLDR
jgi:polyhydroxybutyrate depolymerase